MYKLSIKVLAVFFMPLMFTVFSCTHGSNAAMPVSISALSTDGLIYGDFTPVKACFNAEMAVPKEDYLKSAVSVKDEAQIDVAGIILFEKNEISFTPENKWKTGGKYSLNIKGTFYTAAGRIAKIDESFYFTAFTDDNIPNENTGNNKEEPNNEKPSNGGGGGGNSGGNYTPRPPAIVKPVITEAALLKMTGGSISSAAYNSVYSKNIIEGSCTLQLTFNENMDFSSAMNYIKFTDSRDFICETPNEKTIDIKFEAGIVPQKKLEITVEAGLKSKKGVLTTANRVFEFTGWKPELQITGIEILQSPLPSTIVDLNNLGSAYTVYSDDNTRAYELSFVFQFNKTTDSIEQSGEYPAIILKLPDNANPQQSLPQPMLIDEFCDTVIYYNQDWEIPLAGDALNPVDYEIIIPGGIDGVNNKEGFYIPEDIVVLLKVIKI